MIFNSIHFVIFFIAILGITWLLRRQVMLRNFVLLVASYYFYGSWDWRFLGLLWISTLLDYICARLMLPRESRQSPQPRRNRILVTISIVCNLGLLGFFKYYNFFADSAVVLIEKLGFHVNPFTLDVILPVGISFYTFQTMSYVIDVYRGDMPAEKSLLNFALYVTYFPQLVAGPIERADRLLPQLAAPAHFTWERLYTGVYLIACGMFKKVVIADNVSKVVDMVFTQAHPSGTLTMLGMYAFAIQVYCDFSGYTDIARGASRMMGVDLMQNFDLPYFATNIGSLWRKWHISLGSWLRDYLYIPLGGSRKGRVRTYVNLFITFVLCGLWHGAAWTYVVFGLYHATLMCAHRIARPWMERNLNPQGPIFGPLWYLLRVLVTFHLWCLGLIIFRAKDVANAFSLLKGLAAGFVRTLPSQRESVLIVVACGTLLLGVQLLEAITRDKYVVFRIPRPVRAVVYAAAILCFFAFGEYYGAPFIYFQF